jgi:hypothetical protein
MYSWAAPHRWPLRTAPLDAAYADRVVSHAMADWPLRLLIGPDAPAHVGMALEGWRDDHARDPRFAWPAP